MFSEAELADLRHRFPDRDVDRMAAQCAREHAVKRFRVPIAMLISWLKKADTDNTDRHELYPASEWSPSPLGEHSEPAYAAFRWIVFDRVLAGDSPLQIADLLASRWDEFGVDEKLGVALDQEIADLRQREVWSGPTALPERR